MDAKLATKPSLTIKRRFKAAPARASPRGRSPRK